MNICVSPKLNPNESPSNGLSGGTNENITSEFAPSGGSDILTFDFWRFFD
jgi:hypothetical protein